MKVIRYNDVNTFLKEYEKILLDKEAVSQFVLFNAFMCRESKICEKAVFGAVVNETEVFLLFCILSSQKIIIHVLNPDNIMQAVIHLVEFLAINQITINDIKGNSNVCTNFIEHYKKHIEGIFVKIIGFDIMEIRKVNEIKPAEGTQRLAGPEDNKLITDWMIESQLETLSCEMDYEEVLEKAAIYIEDKKVYLYEKDDMIVSMAVIDRELVNGVILTYVYTPEVYRGEGYAAANVYYISKALLEQGYEFCSVLVDKKNPLTARAYEKIGYVILEDISEYKVFPPDD